MSLLVIPSIECVESQDNFGRFLVEPLQRGFGVTLGNSLRRVLLSYLLGAAVTRIRIEGIQHEFSNIPNVKEDATEFLLNVKQIRLKSLSGRSGKLILDVEGAGQVCAADIKPSTDFEIVNPELYLVTLDSPEAKLYVEFDVELGRGYHLVESGENLPIGVIPVDAVFTPISKVNFTTEPTHVGREAGNERLYLEIWTDGTILPAEAINQGADILIRQLTPFVDYAKVVKIEEEKESLRLSIPEEQYNMPLADLDLSTRTLNSLRRAGINTIGELIGREEQELMALRNFGQKSKRELEERLESLGLSLTSRDREEKEETEYEA